MYQVQKRDGRVVEFDITKINNAIKSAFEAQSKNYHPDVIDFLALKVTSEFESKIKDGIITVEDIQDCVEKVLIQAGYADIAKAYILYRRQRTKLRDTKATIIDFKETMNKYLDSIDWRVKENSTVTYSVGGLILSNSGALTANYWLSEIYDEEIANAHRNVDIHLHDLSMLTGYCFTGDTRVKTLDGSNPTFKELVDNNVTNLWVFAYDQIKHEIVPAQAIYPRVTRTTNELVKVTLTNGTSICSTPDHPYMVRDGSYLEAKFLKPNMSLMPLYIGEKSKYVSINNNWYTGEKKGYLHRWVAEHMLNRPLMDDEVVHHVDGNKHNNSPENLMILADSDHRSQELYKTMKSDVWKINNNKRLVDYNRSEEKRSQMSDFAGSRARDDFGRFAYIHQDRNIAYNHAVRKVEFIRLEQPIEVYDLTVPGYSNFAIDGGVFVHNCAGWSLKQLIQEGLGGVPGKITSSPASHLVSICNQMVNFLGIMQNEWAGAQAFSSFDTYLAPFVKVDNLEYKQVKKCIESFIFGVNTPSRWGTQAPFTNITLDWTVPDDLAELPAIVGGKEMDFKYKDCKKEMDMINKAFIEIMIEGDANGRGFQYPMNMRGLMTPVCA